MKRISSRDNPFFKALRALVDDHREPRRRGETLIDGIHLLQTCIDRGVALRQIIVSTSGVLHPSVIEILKHCDAEPLELTDALFRDVTGVTTPLGIAAVIGIPPVPVAALQGDVLMLDAVQDAGNVGTLLRTAAAAGVAEVMLGRGCAGAWTPRVLRAGQGAHFSLRISEQVDLLEYVEKFRGISVATVAQGGQPLYDTALTPRIAWLFGNEGAGLNAALVTAATTRVTIPMSAATESLNVAAAAAVCLFEAYRQRRLFGIAACDTAGITVGINTRGDPA